MKRIIPFNTELAVAFDGLLDRGAKRLGDAFDPSAVGVRTLAIDGARIKRAKESGGETDEFDGIATTSSIDQDEEVVLPDGLDWSMVTDAKSPYRAMYIDHMYGSAHVVAKITRVFRSRQPDGWRTLAKFMPEEYSDHVRQAKALVAEGLGGLSIGFAVTDRSSPTADERKAFPGARSIVRRAKVFEVSITPMPCNLDCAARALWMSEEKAAHAAELVTKGLMPSWAGRLFAPARKRRVVICV